MKKLIFATRPSALARWQTQWIMDALQAFHPGLVCEEKVVVTQGDKILDKPLPEIGGKGLFTQELECDLLSNVAHCAVHSLKDLPVESVGNLVVGCIPARAEVRDALVSKNGYTLQTLPPASVIGTSSLRRAAQVLAARPDVTTASLRGNVDTRLRKAFEGQYDAIILAGAGLLRLGLEGRVTQWLPLEVMLPAPGQGALAVQCCADDEETLTLLSALDHAPTRAAVTAERQFLLQLGGGCAVPVAAFAEQMIREQRIEISLTGLVSSPDGKAVIRVNGQGADPLQLGLQLAQQALAEGADELLASATSHTLSTVLC
ncbi:MAG: hydroxymethylbilane synthase [Chloroflexota bacterium]